MTTPLRRNQPRIKRYLAYGEGIGAVLAGALVLVLVYAQFRGDFVPRAQLTMLSSRAGLVMDSGSKVTYNGVHIGTVGSISEVKWIGKPAARLVLNVDPRYLDLIPANVTAKITASTVFGNKYVSLTSPKNPSPQRITPNDQIDATSVTTEANTLFETVTSIAEKVDPVKLNLTLSAAAEALTGLGDKFGQSLVNGNNILNAVNPQMPQVRHDIQQLATLANTYAEAAPDLIDFFKNALTTVHTLNQQQHDLDAALLAATGFGDTAGDVVERSRPYLVRGAADLLPSSELLDEYSPEILCTIRIYNDVYPKFSDAEGGNGYSMRAQSELAGPPNPWTYPDNLPRVNARGGPGGKPGCWKPITAQNWPTPAQVMDTGASIAPYNHFAIGQPLFTEYVWGRQFGENTINP